MRKPEALLFDLWGTLIQSEGFEPTRGHAAMLGLCDNPLGVSLQETLDLGARVVKSLESREDESALEFTQFSLMRIIADSFGLRFRLSLEETEWEFWNAALSVRLIDGVRDLLEHLKARGMPLGVVSNSSFVGLTLERELERLGVRRYFEFVISSADYGVRKPDPIIFEIALRRLGRDASRVWFAGDNVGYDIVGGRRAGMFCVAFNPLTAIPSGLGEYTSITRWSELPGLISSAGGA
jgi:putative hydrolase of the HAD superfamily